MEAYYKNLRKEMMRFVPGKYSRVLEVGCGAGVFRSNLTQHNEYWGVEMVESAAKIAEGKLDRVFCGGFIEKADEIPDGYFDLIVCNDVMEHLPDHDVFLKTVKKKLADNGCLVLSVPNIRHIACLFGLLVRKDWKYEDEGVLDRTHLRFFTRKSLERSLRHHGFQIQEIGGINSILSNLPALRVLAIRIASWVLGSDILYLQFGLRSVLSTDSSSGR